MSQLAPWEDPRKLLVKLEEATDPAFGSPPNKRSIDQLFRFGLINLDKPSGPSSHEVVAWVKRMLGLKHAGHGGTLEVHYGSEQSDGDWGAALGARRCYQDHPVVPFDRQRVRVSNGATRGC